MNPKVLEFWMNDTLTDAENIGISGCLLWTDKKPPLEWYKLNWNQLLNNGLSQDQVDRLYWCMYIYSIGFYELLKAVTSHAKWRATLLANIWKIFAILLEYACKNDYKMLISELSKESQEDIIWLEAIVERNNKVFLEKEAWMIQKVEIVSAANEEL